MPWAAHMRNRFSVFSRYSFQVAPQVAPRFIRLRIVNRPIIMLMIGQSTYVYVWQT